ncbi:MAG: hypothetical protein IM628_12800 [Phenylobacterium sp.]|uniref:hypothetical protein n=1 Tax=Phenylobacterium sp. TaxID=1871053 RepID=UPI0025FE56F6|nr:hypothetical protein [Phenylobacterium sp.]MCA6305677.1 hypothetical protein [Phenylobacterium sp.]
MKTLHQPSRTLQSVSDVARWAERRAAVRRERPARHRDLGRLCDHPLARLHQAGSITDAELDAGVAIAIWCEGEAIPGGRGAMPVVDPTRVVVDGGPGVSGDLRTVRTADVDGDVRAWAAWADRTAVKGAWGAGRVTLAVCRGRGLRDLEVEIGLRNGRLAGVVATALRGFATRAYRSVPKRGA